MANVERRKALRNSWHYIVGDIHGCYEELLKLEKKIYDHAKKNKKRPFIISVGDIIDRGPNSKDVVEHFMEGRKRGTHDIVMGNHEAMMLASLQVFNPKIFKDIKRRYPSWLYTYKERFLERSLEKKMTWGDYLETLETLWFGQGGKETLESYGVFSKDPKDWVLPKAHLNFILSLKPVLILKKTLVTHALPKLEYIQKVLNVLGTRKRVTTEVKAAVYSLFWNRSMIGVEGINGKTLVSGHTPMPSIKRHKGQKVIQIDTACYSGERLTAWCPEKDKVFFVRAHKRYF